MSGYLEQNSREQHPQRVLLPFFAYLCKKSPLIHCESEDSFHMGGRGDRTRTCDSLVPNQERYQLRYTSVKAKRMQRYEKICTRTRIIVT